MVDLIERIDPARVRANLQRISSEIEDAAATGVHGRPGVQIVAATKYVPARELPALAEGGVELVGENRAQDLASKVAAHGGLFAAWDFIGRLQSRRVRTILPHVRLIHSVASPSALAEVERHRQLAGPSVRILLQVDVAEEEGKAGIAPTEIASYVARAPVPVAGLMTMPPLTADPQASRPWFAALRRLAAEHGLEHLSMGTSQDYVVAVEEGATIVRIGTNLYH
jgi:pyridoxal phosphate enzyme (YggS family)